MTQPNDKLTARKDAARARREADEKNGVVRIGGRWWSSDYAGHYFRATEALSSLPPGERGHLPLALLYLQRHTVELLIKNLIDGCAGVSEAQQDLDGTTTLLPAAEFEHDLESLLTTLEGHFKATGYAVPAELITIVKGLSALEQKSPERFRYDSVKVAKKLERSFEHEIAVPIANLQTQLREVFRIVAHNDDGLQRALYDEYQHLFQEAVRLGIVQL